jgi:tRNA(adenine34) deaminase
MKYVNFDEEASTQTTDLFFMNEAFKEAQKALEADEVPIGAIIVHNGRIIGRGHNLTEQLHDVTAHAEMQAFTAASNYIGGKYLHTCTLYVTIEPCIMCAGASYWAQISRIVFGSEAPQRGFSQIKQRILHPKTQVVQGIKAEECSTLLKDFFSAKRNKL